MPYNKKAVRSNLIQKGDTELPDFTGTGNRMIVTDSDGNLLPQPISNTPGQTIEFATEAEWLASIADKAVSPDLIKSKLDAKVDASGSKVLTDENYTLLEKNKLALLPQNPVRSVNGVSPDPTTGNVIVTTGTGAADIRVSTIAIRNALTGLADNQNVFVVDATGDPTVSSGGAYYKYVLGNTSWIKLSEAESMDLTFAGFTRDISGENTVIYTWANTLNTFFSGVSSVAAGQALLRSTLNWLASKIIMVEQSIPALSNILVSSLTEIVTQTAHGFPKFSVIRHNGTSWVRTLAVQVNNTDASSEVFGVVSQVIDADTFILTTKGKLDTTGLNLLPGTAYFASPTVPGALTAAPPTEENHVVKPVLMTGMANTAYVVNYIGEVLGAGGTTAPGIGTGTVGDLSNFYTILQADLLLAGKSNNGHTHIFETITDKPTTLAGYGINNAYTSAQTDLLVGGKSDINHTHTFAQITNKPTTVAEYGITDALTAVGTGIAIETGLIVLDLRNYTDPDAASISVPYMQVVTDDGMSLTDGRNTISMSSLPPGSRDPEFIIGTGFNNFVHAINLRPDGKMLLSGDFTSYDGLPVNGIVLLNIDGSRDMSFNIGTGVNSGGIRVASLQFDGKLLIGGGFTSYNGVFATRLVRINVDGSRDTSFGTGGGFDVGVRAITPQPDGKNIIGGDFTLFNSIPASRIIRLNANGSRDLSFVTGNGFNSFVMATALQLDGRVLVGGDFTAYNGVQANRICRLNIDGSRDTTFLTGTGFNGGVWAMAIMADGKILASGDFTQYNGVTANRVVRLNPNGTLDTSFNAGVGFNGIVRSVNLQSDGRVIVGGAFTTYNGVSANRIARLNTDGSSDPTFVMGTGFNGLVLATNIQVDGKLLVGGNFTTYDNFTSNAIVRLLASQGLTANSPRGIEYTADFSAAYSARSLVDKAFVESRVANAGIVPGGGISSASALTDTVTQTGHGLVVGRVLGNIEGFWVLANAISSAAARSIGIVSQVIDANTFVLTTSGKMNTGVMGLASSTIYYLSATPGVLTATLPTGGLVVRPVLMTTDASTGYVFADAPGTGDKANVSGQVFAGDISAPNLSGTNTGDETAVRIISRIGNGTVINAQYLTNYYTKPESDALIPFTPADADNATGYFAGLLATGKITPKQAVDRIVSNERTFIRIGNLGTVNRYAEISSFLGQILPGQPASSPVYEFFFHDPGKATAQKLIFTGSGVPGTPLHGTALPGQPYFVNCLVPVFDEDDVNYFENVQLDGAGLSNPVLVTRNSREYYEVKLRTDSLYSFSIIASISNTAAAFNLIITNLSLNSAAAANQKIVSTPLFELILTITGGVVPLTLNQFVVTFARLTVNANFAFAINSPVIGHSYNISVTTDAAARTVTLPANSFYSGPLTLDANSTYAIRVEVFSQNGTNLLYRWTITKYLPA